MNLDNIAWLYTGRFLTGFGSGTYTLVAPVYIFEICEMSIRGALESSVALMIVIGHLSVVTMNLFMTGEAITIVCLVMPVIVAGKKAKMRLWHAPQNQ